MALKAVLFDLDDTLYDHQHSCRTALMALQQQYACFKAATFRDFEWQHSELLERYHLDVLQGKLTLDEARLARFRALFKQYGETVDEIGLQQTVSTYREAYLGAERLIAGAVELLEQLRANGIRIGVVTNNAVDEQMRKLKQLKLEGLIDVLVISEAIGIAKPDPRIFAEALNRLGCRPDEVVMVGDSWSADVLGARAAGIRAIWLNRYSASCPDAALACELTAFEPLETILELLQPAQPITASD